MHLWKGSMIGVHEEFSGSRAVGGEEVSSSLELPLVQIRKWNIAYQILRIKSVAWKAWHTSD